MANVSEPAPPRPMRGRSRGMLVALAGALVSGSAGFLATQAGLLDPIAARLAGSGGAEAGTAHVFVALDPLTISLGPQASARLLRFTAQLEVESEHADSVAALTPRIVDVLNSYLRAVDEAELADPTALALIRAQMLHRIQTVTGQGRVRDLLILEFILN